MHTPKLRQFCAMKVYLNLADIFLGYLSATVWVIFELLVYAKMQTNVFGCHLTYLHAIFSPCGTMKVMSLRQCLETSVMHHVSYAHMTLNWLSYTALLYMKEIYSFAQPNIEKVILLNRLMQKNKWMNKNICLTLNHMAIEARVLKDIHLKMYISDMGLLCKQSNKKYSMLLTCKQSTSDKNIYKKSRYPNTISSQQESFTVPQSVGKVSRAIF